MTPHRYRYDDLTIESRWVITCYSKGGYPIWLHTFVSSSTNSRGAVVSYWRNYVHEVLVNRLGGLSLPRKSVVRLTDRPDMTLDVYRGHKTTTQQSKGGKSKDDTLIKPQRLVLYTSYPVTTNATDNNRRS